MEERKKNISICYVESSATLPHLLSGASPVGSTRRPLAARGAARMLPSRRCYQCFCAATVSSSHTLSLFPSSWRRRRCYGRYSAFNGHVMVFTWSLYVWVGAFLFFSCVFMGMYSAWERLYIKLGVLWRFSVLGKCYQIFRVDLNNFGQLLPSVYRVLFKWLCL